MLQISDLSAGYGNSVVLRGFSLEVAAGEVAAIIGPNGCGKSTLLRCIAGGLDARAGSVRIGADDVFALAPRDRARRIALLPQNSAGGENLTVEEMVGLGRTPHLSPYGAPGKRDEAIVAQSLQRARAEEFCGRRVGELSGGERQRVTLARALAQQPQLLLLDEPTSNLDIRYQYEILDVVQRLARDEKLAVVLVLHQINLAAAVADTLVLMNSDGTVRASGSPQNVMTSENLAAVYQMPLTVAISPQGHPHAVAAWQFQGRNDN
ncbi:MAG TPA: ABC transporter ATP-binding protein [Abditibacteriaceae bacterium]|jgi:iron complex transport system ATP-binding protein